MFDLNHCLLQSAAIKPAMPLVMGVLNVTPDSFSDGGEFVELDVIKQRVEQMLNEGVDIIDIGGESTRPGAEEVALEVELNRVLPVIEWISTEYDIPVSIDTYKTEVMKQAVAAGAVMVNDVNALQAEGAVEFVAQSGIYACLMHKKGSPKDMQLQPTYGDVVTEVVGFLQHRVQVCEQAGIPANKLILDPGFGFGKTLAHNTQLFSELSQFVETGFPILVGVSKKRMIGEILDDAPLEARLHGSVAAATLAGLKGAKIVRVHDVQATVDSLRVVSQLL